ncbi:serine/threonine-protein kinase PCRK1-like protein [Tanacetum coccineum]
MVAMLKMNHSLSYQCFLHRANWHWRKSFREGVCNYRMSNKHGRILPKCAQETIQESCVLALAYKPLHDMTITDCGFGSVHIGIIKSLEHPFDDIRVVVKRGGHKEWEVKVKVNGEIKHQNLVKQIGYCNEDDEYESD